jgi:DNA excision repair protein ERCC-1
MAHDFIDGAALEDVSTASRAPASGQSRGPDASATYAAASTSNSSKVEQPKPQALPQRAGPSSILVSTRQKGNPVLNSIRSHAWEYSDIPADFVLGATTCALFLSLKYHRLHPEYIYNRIRGLQGKYNLRILLVMVDIQNHEESLKELSKTSLINNVTIILAWSAAEAGRWLELYKMYEHAPPTAIRSHQNQSDGDRLIEFITTPRSINKNDAVALVSNFGSVRTAVNARPEEVLLLPGWGEKKVQRWCQAVREPFRVRKAAKRVLDSEETAGTLRDLSNPKGESVTHMMQSDANAPKHGDISDAGQRLSTRPAEDVAVVEPDEHVGAEASAPSRKRPASPEMSDGVMAALAKLRQNG